jgi:hypothetical protein
MSSIQIRLFASAVLGLLASMIAAAGATDGLPPEWREHVTLRQSFDTTSAEPWAPDIEPGPEPVADKRLTDEGLRGRAYLAADGHSYRLAHEALSLHKPLTVSLWWTLDEKPGIDGAFSVMRVHGAKRAMVLVFSKGRGKWKALKHPVGAFQIINVPDVKNVSVLWSGDLLEAYDMMPGRWHHAALVVRSGGRVVELCIDGESQHRATLIGGRIKKSHKLHTWFFGSRFKGELPMRLDELVVLDRALDAESISAYYKGTRALLGPGRESGTE